MRCFPAPWLLFSGRMLAEFPQHVRNDDFMPLDFRRMKSTYSVES